MTTERVCQNTACGKALTKKTQKRYCSQPCASSGAIVRPRRPVACPCGTVINAWEPDRKYCSEPCRRRFTPYGKAPGYLPREIGKVWRY